MVEGEEAHHIRRVLRMQVGDSLVLFDGEGKEYTGFISEIAGQKVVVTLAGEAVRERDVLLPVVLVQGIPRYEKMDLILQKGTELGMMKLVPVLTRRTLLKEKGDNFSHRQQRWQRIVLEAAKQCRRATVPGVENICRLEEVLRGFPSHACGLMLWEEEREVYLKPLLRAWEEQAGKEQEGEKDPGAEKKRKELWIFVGPEGGFDREEVEMARRAGIQTVSLGKRILRTETVALAVLSILMYEWGDLGSC